MLFSATLSFRVNELAYEHMNNPRTIQINPEQRTAERVEQRLYHVASTEKITLLVGVLRDFDGIRTIVFVNTKRVGAKLVQYLRANGCSSRSLSGDVVQAKRQRLIEDFKKGKINVVVATDVAARGLHIPGVELVINYDLPQNCEDYVHRIGRTARAGAKGLAVSFACEEFVFSLGDIEEYIGLKIPVSLVKDGSLPKLKKPINVEAHTTGENETVPSTTKINRRGKKRRKN